MRTHRHFYNDIVEHKREKNYEINRADQFRYRTWYISDSGVIGTKEFVSMLFQRFKDVFISKTGKDSQTVAGFHKVYSLKKNRGRTDNAFPMIADHLSRIYLKILTDSASTFEATGGLGPSIPGG